MSEQRAVMCVVTRIEATGQDKPQGVFLRPNVFEEWYAHAPEFKCEIGRTVPVLYHGDPMNVTVLDAEELDCKDLTYGETIKTYPG